MTKKNAIVEIIIKHIPTTGLRNDHKESHWRHRGQTFAAVLTVSAQNGHALVV